jgi:membrane protease subunit HflC
MRDEPGAIARLNDIVSARLRQEIAQHNFIDIVREKRGPIMAAVTRGVSEQAIAFGIEVRDVRIKRLDLPAEVQASVFARMKAERERIAKRYRAEGEERALEIRATADKEREIILATAYSDSQRLRGEGDAQATAITAAAFGRDIEFYAFLRRLEAYEKILGERATLILRPDSDLLRHLETPTFVPPIVEAAGP